VPAAIIVSAARADLHAARRRPDVRGHFGSRFTVTAAMRASVGLHDLRTVGARAALSAARTCALLGRALGGRFRAAISCLVIGSRGRRTVAGSKVAYRAALILRDSSFAAHPCASSSPADDPSRPGAPSGHTSASFSLSRASAARPQLHPGCSALHRRRFVPCEARRRFSARKTARRWPSPVRAAEESCPFGRSGSARALRCRAWGCPLICLPNNAALEIGVPGDPEFARMRLAAE